MPSELEDAIERTQEAIERGEAVVEARMQGAYGDVVDRAEEEIELAIQRGPAGEVRQRRLASLLDQVEEEFDRFAATGQRVIREGRRSAAFGGSSSAQDLMRATDMTMGTTVQLNAPAVEQLIGALDSRPVQASLNSYGTHAAGVIERTLVPGLATGENPRRVVRRIMGEIDSPMMRARVDSLVQTEMMRAWRGGMNAQYAQVDHLIGGYMRVETKDHRTCLACVALDGQVSATPHGAWHIRCRGVDAPIPYGYANDYEPGASWFARLPEDVQRAMMPSQEAYDAYRSGSLPLSAFVGYRDDGVWGVSIVELSGRQALETPGVVRPRSGQPLQDARGLPATDTAERVQGMRSGDELLIADAPAPGIDAPGGTVLRHHEREHIYRSHPELRGEEHLIVEAAREPDRVFRDPVHPDTYAVARRQSDRHDTFVSMELQEEGWLRVKSARTHGARRTDRLMSRSESRFGEEGILLDEE